MEEDKTSNINVNLYNKYVNVTMGVVSLTFIINTTIVPPPPQTSTIPPTSTIVVSPTYKVVMNEHITSLFLSQSIEVEKIVNEEEADEDDIMVIFADLQMRMMFLIMPSSLVNSSRSLIQN